MKLSSKVLFSSFLILALSVGALGLIFYNFEKDRILSEYDNRHKLLIDIISASLKSYEIASESKAKNALLYLKSYEKTFGLPNNLKLKEIATELSISNFYVTDKDGFFIRNTEDEDNSVPKGLFSFCPGYKNLTYGETQLEKTPIIPSFPYSLPFKFYMIPNHNRTRVLEAGMHFDDFAEVLGSAVESADDLLSISLFTPTGAVLGHYSKERGIISSTIDNKSAATEKISIPPAIKSTDHDKVIHISKIYSDIKNCCECSVKNLLNDGKYYYFLRSIASTKNLNVALAIIRTKILVIISALLVLVYLLSNWIVRNHLRYFQQVITYVSNLDLKKLTSARIDVNAKDEETKQLSKAINSLVDELSASYQAIEKASAAEAYYKLSRQIAHDIRSPLMALKVLEESLTDIGDDKRILLVKILSRISEILSGLRKHTLTSKDTHESEKHLQTFNLTAFLIVLLSEKKLLLVNEKKIDITFKPDCDVLNVYIKLEPIEFYRALSNLLDNAIEAIDKQGNITISVFKVSDSRVNIAIEDSGKGMSEETLKKLGNEGFSHGKQGSGLGYAQAKKTIEVAGGSISATSILKERTKVDICIPTIPHPKWHTTSIELKNSTLVLIDDDKNVVSLWLSNPNYNNSTKLHYFESTDAFLLEAPNFSPDTIVVCDYNFGSFGNSDAFIRKYHQFFNFVLSTNMFDDKNVATLCESLKISMVPKPLVPYIDIK